MKLEVLEPNKPQIKFDDDPLVSFIVPVHANNLDPSIFKRCLMSLDDQDYGNMEVIVVLNGGRDEKLERTANYFVDKDPKKFQLIVDETPGACRARNTGFKASKGSIVSFFCSDYRAKPGMVRMWVDELGKHPECGFIYGGYEYATVPMNVYPSKDFDTFELSQANFIDSGFPIRREHVAEWDDRIKSLQDWDFWLSVAYDNKVKGHYLGREFSYVAEPPRPKGLTNDSSDHWIERVTQVREKHGIKTSDLVVTSIGARYHAKEIAKMLGADYRDDTIFKPNAYKALYMIGFFMRPDQRQNGHPEILGSFKKEVRKIIHFVGADIYWLRKFPWDALKILAGVMKKGADVILCENEQAQGELKAFGIDAQIVPIPPYNEYDLRPFPKDFNVGIYLTDKSDFDKYFQKHTLSIVKSMPDVLFTGYGDGAKDFASPNFKHAGNMPKEKWKEFVYEHSCILRLVRHDTLPMAPCEFLLAGRPVVTNIPMAFTNVIDTSGNDPINDWDPFAPGFSDLRWPETKKKIVQAIRGCRQTKLLTEAHTFYSKLLNREKYISTIQTLSQTGEKK